MRAIYLHNAILALDIVGRGINQLFFFPPSLTSVLTLVIEVSWNIYLYRERDSYFVIRYFYCNNYPTMFFYYYSYSRRFTLSLYYL